MNLHNTLAVSIYCCLWVISFHLSLKVSMCFDPATMNFQVLKPSRYSSVYLHIQPRFLLLSSTLQFTCWSIVMYVLGESTIAGLDSRVVHVSCSVAVTAKHVGACTEERSFKPFIGNSCWFSVTQHETVVLWGFFWPEYFQKDYCTSELLIHNL